MNRDELLDNAIAEAKEAKDWQLVECLRMARGTMKASKWYTEKLVQLKAENDKLRKLARVAIKSVCFDCPHRRPGRGSCDGCNLYEMATELGVKTGWRWADET